MQKIISVKYCKLIPRLTWPEYLDTKKLKLFVTKNGHKNHKFKRVDGMS